MASCWVHFACLEHAAACQNAMDDSNFAGTRIRARLWHTQKSLI